MSMGAAVLLRYTQSVNQSTRHRQHRERRLLGQDLLAVELYVTASLSAGAIAAKYSAREKEDELQNDSDESLPQLFSKIFLPPIMTPSARHYRMNRRGRVKSSYAGRVLLGVSQHSVASRLKARPDEVVRVEDPRPQQRCTRHRFATRSVQQKQQTAHVETGLPGCSS